MEMKVRAFFVVHLILACRLVQVSRSQSEDSDADFYTAESIFHDSRLEILSEDADSVEPFHYGRKLLGVMEPSEVDSVWVFPVFPKNNGRSFVAGKKSELVVGVKNIGESTLVMIAIICNIHLLNNHLSIVQRLTPQTFINLAVKPSAMVALPYFFTISKEVKVGTYSLVCTIYYIMDHKPSNRTFYNGTINIVESRGMIIVRTVVLTTVGFAFLFFLWQGFAGISRILSDKKKAKKAKDDADWLEGTAAAPQSSSKKKRSKKRK